MPASFELLARSVHADGEVEVLLYAFGETESGERCVATTLVGKGRSGWRARRSGPLACGVLLQDPEEPLLIYAGGKGAADLATIFGVAPGGERVDVHWADDLVQVSQIQDGYVLVTRQGATSAGGDPRCRRNDASHPGDGTVKMGWKLRSIILVALLVITTAMLFLSARLVDRYLPYRPTYQEATTYVLAQEGKQLTEPVTGHMLAFTNIEILDLFSGVPGALVVVKTMERTESDGALVVETAYCVEADYMTRHWLSGVRAYSGTGPGCVVRDKATLYPPIRIQGKREKGTYLLTGLAIDDRINAVKAQWPDGESIAPVVNNAFVFFRAEEIEVTSVVGLDRQGAVITDTITANRGVHFTPLDYTAYEEVVMGDGVVVLGAYSLSGPQPQECLEVTYLTTENAEKFLKGEQYFIGQRGCVIGATDEMIAPIVSTNVAGDRVISGRIHHDDIVHVRVQWTDGLVQTVPVLEGSFFFARRPTLSGVSLRSEAITGLDSHGNSISP